ncbi:ABC transporter G family member 22-like [Cynara cardunculus var. scolymus]|uniref:ABC transporter G family member 22-like n=1 Tax=Cynara cardunculus var. scolymus TaxID=59895 RepID=UPI000D6287E8|nr:ABC transporter G family member 22-like [Cynara cardunculus var. scolymus]
MPIYLKFEDVKYTISSKGKRHDDHNSEKLVLQGITGCVQPGEVLALMGPSGGGKTTLLNLLSGRLKNRSGSITYNDHPYHKSLRPRIGYVLQDDVVFPHLTIKETLTYTALLRLPSTLKREVKMDRAINIIAELGLERCQDTLIGGPFSRGISGGERKRVCIGTEILLNPSLLFLDEPTSGLDSTTALRIVQTLQNMALAGKTVVATIHQPSSRLFAKFDKLFLLGKGSFLYAGKASEAMTYFSSIGCSPYIAMNPAEFLIDLANGNMNDKSIPSELENKFIPCSESEPSPMDVHEYLLEAYEARLGTRRKLKMPLLTNGECAFQDSGATWFEQFVILFNRGFKERRHVYLSTMRVIQVMATALIVALLWWHPYASGTPNRLHEQAGLLFFVSVFWTFFPLFTAIFTFPMERPVLAKERSVEMYNLSAYLVAKNMSDIPLDLILPLLFVSIVYFLVGLLRSFNAFVVTLFIVFLCVIAAQGLGQAIGAAFHDTRKATTLASIIVMAFMLAGGFFVQNVPSFMSWIRYISFNYHTYRLLLKIQSNCFHSDPDSGLCKSGSVMKGNPDWGGVEVGALLIMVFGYRLLAYLFLRRMKLMHN